jgi:transposase InsO family protein
MFERISIDTVGPFPKDVYGNEYIVVIIDNFSRYVELYCVPNTEARPAASCLLQWVGRYGVPSQLGSDNGPQFINAIIAEFLDMIGTEHDHILAYSKEENALVERANKEVNRHLRAIIYYKGVDAQWSLYLPMV